MGLMDVFTAVEETLKTTLKDLVAADMIPPTKPPKFEVGAVSRAREGDYPRIVWVPTSESFTAPDSQGGEFDRIRNPRPLWKRKSRVEADVWGKDIADCEVIANHLVAAVHTCGVGAYGPQAAQWSTSSVIQRGCVYTLAFVFDIPFTREPDRMSLAITDFPETVVVIPPAATG